MIFLQLKDGPSPLEEHCHSPNQVPVCTVAISFSRTTQSAHQLPVDWNKVNIARWFINTSPNNIATPVIWNAVWNAFIWSNSNIRDGIQVGVYAVKKIKIRLPLALLRHSTGIIVSNPMQLSLSKRIAIAPSLHSHNKHSIASGPFLRSWFKEK